MKPIRMTIIIALITLAVLGSGCSMKVWRYNFKSLSADLDDWYHNFGTYRLDSSGLCLDERYINTPYYFIGDITITLDFELHVSESAPASIEIGLSDNIFWGGSNETWLGLYQLGLPLAESWRFGDYSSSTGQNNHDHAGVIAELNHNGDNVVVFSRVGNVISIIFNGTDMGDFPLEKFAASNCFPTLSAAGDFGTLIITRVKVDYTEKSEKWPVV